MQDYYEELWQRLPEQLTPPDFERRRAFLLEEIRAGDRALDLGCGTGEFTALLAHAGAEPVGVEVAALGFDEVRVRTAGGAPLLRRMLLARAVR